MTTFGGLGSSIADLVTADIGVEADLTFSLDGSSARLTGSGQRLLLHLDSAASLLNPVPVRSPLRAVVFGADILRRAGIRLDVATDRGPLVSVGAGVRSSASPFARLPPIAVQSPAALAQLGSLGFSRLVRGRGPAILLAAGAVALVVGRRVWESGDR